MMTITLSPETESLLLAKIQREGGTIDVVAESLIQIALAWEAQEREEAIAGILRGEQAAAEGRERSLSDFLAEQRIKHGFAPTWPQDASLDEDRSNAA